MRRSSTALAVALAILLPLLPGRSHAQDSTQTRADSASAVTPAPAATPAPTSDTAATATATSTAPAPTKVLPGARVYVESDDFGMALTAAFLKKKVPVMVVQDSTKADFWINTTTHAKEEKTAVKIVRFIGGAGSGDRFDASVVMVNRDGTVVFAYTSRKENSQSAAQNVAKNLKKLIEKK